MKKIINGKKYDTETAKLLGQWTNFYPVNDFKHCKEELYQKKSGEFFLYGEGGPLSKYSKGDNHMMCSGENIFPFSEKEALEWSEEHLDVDRYEELFGKVEE